LDKALQKNGKKKKLKVPGLLISTTASGISVDLLSDSLDIASVLRLNHIKTDNTS
jgi:hypothetical protein